MSADQVDRAGGAVDSVDVHTDTSTEETALHHRHLDRESGEITVDQDDDVADLCSVVGVEPAAGCTSVDRHLELLASTVRLEQIDDGRAALPGDVGHGGFGDIESHGGVNRCGAAEIPLSPSCHEANICSILARWQRATLEISPSSSTSGRIRRPVAPSFGSSANGSRRWLWRASRPFRCSARSFRCSPKGRCGGGASSASGARAPRRWRWPSPQVRRPREPGRPSSATPISGWLRSANWGWLSNAC